MMIYCGFQTYRYLKNCNFVSNLFFFVLIYSYYYYKFKKMNLNPVINSKSNFLNTIYLLIIIFFFSISIKANEYDDFVKIGFQKEKLSLIYSDYLRVIDAVTNLEEIITGLEEGSVNKKDAMVEGTKLIKETQNLILDTTTRLNNLDPLILSESMKDYENLYQEFTNFLKNEIRPAMNNEINLYESSFLNALKGEFEDPITRYLNSLDRIIIAVSSENKLLELEINITDDLSPSKSKAQLVLSSNVFILHFLEAFMYIFENFYAASDNVASGDELLDYFSKLEISFANSINNSEIFFSEGLENMRLFKKDMEDSKLTEQELAWANEVYLIYDEGFAIEQEVINSMKNNAKNFTIKNLSENDNALNELLAGFDELYYYSTLREEVAIKEANALQKMQELK